MMLDEEEKKQVEFDKKYLKELEEEKENNRVSKKSIIDSIKTTEEDIEREKKYIKNYDELPQLLEEHIRELIETITNYKNYFDLSCNILDETLYTKENLEYFKEVFSSKIVLPKTHIYNAFCKCNSIIVPMNNLIFDISEERKENNVELLKKYVLESIKSNEKIYCKIYEINSLEDILNIYLSLFIENKLIINKCKNCGKYFIPSKRSDEKYCDNISPQNKNKTCKEYAPANIYRKKMNNDKIKKEHYTTSQYYRMRIKRCEEKKKEEKLVNRFEKYKKEYELKKEKYQNEKLTEEKFIEWIRNQKDLKQKRCFQ